MTTIAQDAIPFGFSPDRLTLITSDGEYQEGFWPAVRYGDMLSYLSADGWVKVYHKPGSHSGLAVVEHQDGSTSRFDIDIDYSV